MPEAGKPLAAGINAVERTVTATELAQIRPNIQIGVNTPRDQEPWTGTAGTGGAMSTSDDAIERTPGFRFDAFRLDHRGGLCRLNGSGTAEPVALGSRALDVLKTLVESDGELGPVIN